MVKKLTSFDEFKRVLYLFMIPLILLALIFYNVMTINTGENHFTSSIVRLLIAWYFISWILVYKNQMIRLVELVTLVIISFSHLATVYDTIFNSIVSGEPNAIGIKVVWVPAVIITFFLILKARWGVIYSLVIFFINLAFAFVCLPDITHEYRISLAQFYMAYLFYILIFYLALNIMRLFTELESMKKHALTDSLTGIANRHQIDSWFEESINKLDKKGIPLSVLFFDMDYFKRVNDTYGHKVGDYVLKELAVLIQGNLQDSDRFGRWGGEEFIILTHRTVDEASELAEMLRQRVKEHHFEVAGKQTVSLGVTEYTSGESIDALLHRVDQALYESKNSGRDRVTVK
jgi:diguanylate cyclase (GGDEF)-like protein